MRYDVKNRIMSLSFKRQPEEHADVMLAAGRRLVTVASTAASGRKLFVAVVAFGAAIGIFMEIYRRLVLKPLLGVEDVTPVNIIALQFLPVVLLVIAALYWLSRFASRRRRQGLIARLEPDQFIDTDIYREGIRSTAGPVVITMDWAAVLAVSQEKARIEFEGETFTMYIPQRAFESRKAFEAAASEFRTLWQDARRKQMVPGAPGKI